MTTPAIKRAPSLRSLTDAFPTVPVENLGKIRRSIQRGEVRMRRIDALLENHGVEVISDKDGGIVAEYSNSGDSYASTILYVIETDSFRLTTVGDFVETYERRHARLP